MAHLAGNGTEVTFVAAFSDEPSDTARGLAIGGTRFSKVDLRGGHIIVDRQTGGKERRRRRKKEREGGFWGAIDGDQGNVQCEGRIEREEREK